MPLSAKVALEMHSATPCPGDSANGMCIRYWLETPEGEVLRFDKRTDLDAVVANAGWALVGGEVDKTPRAKLENFIGKCHDRKCKGDMQPDGTVLSYRLLTPYGHKLLVTRAEALGIATNNGWRLQDTTNG